MDAVGKPLHGNRHCVVLGEVGERCLQPIAIVLSVPRKTHQDAIDERGSNLLSLSVSDGGADPVDEILNLPTDLENAGVLTDLTVQRVRVRTVEMNVFKVPAVVRRVIFVWAAAIEEGYAPRPKLIGAPPVDQGAARLTRVEEKVALDPAAADVKIRARDEMSHPLDVIIERFCRVGGKVEQIDPFVTAFSLYVHITPYNSQIL